MITKEELNQLRTESLLSESFVVLIDSCGDKYAAFGENLVDINTFRLMLVWRAYGGIIHKRLIKNRGGYIEYLITLNIHDNGLKQIHDYNIIDYLYAKFITATSTDSISDIIDRYRNQIND
jgi:hypothetical protein